MVLSEDELLGACKSIAQFSEARRAGMPSRAARDARMPRKVLVPSSPTKATAKRTACTDFWCMLALATVALVAYGIWRVPRHSRTVANFESKLHSISRALGGELEQENRGLTDTLRVEKRKEAVLLNTEEILRKQLTEAQSEQDALQSKLKSKEMSYESAQKDIIKTRVGLQNWHQKSDELRSQLGLVQLAADHSHQDLQRVHSEKYKAEQHAHQLELSLAAAKKEIEGFKTSERHLRGQLQQEEHWHHATVERIHQFKAAEETLLKSVDVDA